MNFMVKVQQLSFSMESLLCSRAKLQPQRERDKERKEEIQKMVYQHVCLDKIGECICAQSLGISGLVGRRTTN